MWIIWRLNREAFLTAVFADMHLIAPGFMRGRNAAQRNRGSLPTRPPSPAITAAIQMRE